MSTKYFSTDIIKFLFDDEIILYMSEKIFDSTNFKIDLELFLFILKYYLNNYIDRDIIFEDLNEQEFINKCNERLNDIINISILFIEENNKIQGSGVEQQIVEPIIEMDRVEERSYEGQTQMYPNYENSQEKTELINNQNFINIKRVKENENLNN